MIDFIPEAVVKLHSSMGAVVIEFVIATGAVEHYFQLFLEMIFEQNIQYETFLFI